MCLPVGCECEDQVDRGWISTGRCVGRNGLVEEVPPSPPLSLVHAVLHNHGAGWRVDTTGLVPGWGGGGGGGGGGVESTVWSTFSLTVPHTV